jgi:sterol desaturase/sphingolipid hydroxylase (fatty acid hydroxylase superfamily)
MSDLSLGAAAPSVRSEKARASWLWMLPQPFLVLGSMVAIATMITQRWMNPDLFTTLMILLPIPLLIVAERVWTKREDWLLTPKEFAEDAFWLGFAALLWIPLYDDFYSTPLSEAFAWLRDRSPFDLTLAPTTVGGLLGAVLLVKLVESFIYYWCHRIQHESLFFWRMHATHHHITKMGCLRGDRTHPLEYLTLALGTPIALALFGASEDVIAVTAAFHFWNGNLNHANLPLRSLPGYDWIFATAPQHHAHHALELRQSNSNYGCNIILWDRLFGTYCGDETVGEIGAGTGKALSIREQLALAFYPNKRLTQL